MKNFIIGIAGAKNSGKDTIASMINYIFAVGIASANYANYIIRKSNTDNINSDRIVHFADNMKDIMSIIFGIPRDAFDDRTTKDKKYWDYLNKRFVSFTNVMKDKNSFIINNTDELLYPNTLSEIIRTAIKEDKNIYIKVRTLMQYFGTNICRYFLDEDIWIRSAMIKITNIAIARKLCIIPDIRFANEAKAIRVDNASLYGGVIKVNRDNNDNNDNNGNNSNNDNSEHSSEIIDFITDFEIDNNGTLMQLFYKVLEICQALI